MDDQALDDPARGAVDRDGEAETDPGDGRVDADDPAARIGERAAGVAGVECRVGLDDVLDEPARPPVARRERPTERADDARRHGAREAERVADRDDELTDAQPLGVAERRRVAAARRSSGRRRGPTADRARRPGTRARRRRRTWRFPCRSPATTCADVDEVADRLDGDRRTGTARRPATDLARDAQAGDGRDQPLGRRRDGDRVRVEAAPSSASSSTSGTGRAGAPARPPRSGLPGRGRAATDLDGPLVVAAHELDLERELERAERRVQVVGVGDRLAAGLDDQVAGLDPGRCREAAVLDATDEDAVTLGEPDRTAHPPGDVRRRDRDAEARTASGDSPRPSASTRSRRARRRPAAPGRSPRRSGSC